MDSNNQMGHEPDLNRLAALAEGRLSPDERETVLAHLADCKDCRDVLAAISDGSTTAPGSWWRRPAVWGPLAASVAVLAIGALLVTDRTTTRQAAPVQESPGGDVRLPDSVSPQGFPAGTPGPVPVQPPPSGDLKRRRSGERDVAGKTFSLVAGEWIDANYEPDALLPEVDVDGAESRRELLERLPALAPYAALGARVTVVYEGMVYRFVP